VGKRQRNEAQWRGLVEEWRASGLSKEAFARSHGVSPSTLGWWTCRFRNEVPAPRFLEVVVAPPAAPAPDLLVELGDLRVRVPRGFDAAELRRLVDALC